MARTKAWRRAEVILGLLAYGFVFVAAWSLL